MGTRWELGPVFRFESLLSTRRKQVYAGRALFVLVVLGGLVIVWFTSERSNIGPGPRPSTYEQMARLGELFFYTMAGIQISLVMLVAPAATAGSICMDRARGTLVHMLMTDLSTGEIVLGKLGARLAPVIGIIMCGVPVAALVMLLGGIEFRLILAVLAVSIALAALGCTLALAISVWAAKTHEVLIAVYLLGGLWLLSLPLWWGWSASGSLMPPPEWFQKVNPYVLIFANWSKPDFVGTTDYVAFVGSVLALSAGFAILCVARLRQVLVRESGRRQKPGLRLPRLRRVFPTLAGPSLDGNPVLWREWHRSQPSRLARVLWITVLGITWILAAWGTYEVFHEGPGGQNRSFLGMGLGLQLLFGTLILSATAPTVLAEERVRGSLDILLTTPLSTRAIVVGKWLGACRGVLVLALLPVYGAILLAAITPTTPEWLARFPQTTAIPLNLGDRIAAVVFCTIDVVVSCALLVSLGLLIATWVPRLGRAVALSVVAYFLSGIGWLFLVQFLFIQFLYTQPAETIKKYQWLQNVAMAFSPVFGSFTSITVLDYADTSRLPTWISIGIVTLAKAAITALFLWVTVKSFDHCMGRMPESGLAAPKRESMVEVELVPSLTE